MRSPAKYSSSCDAVSLSTGDSSSTSAHVASLVRQPDADQYVAVAFEYEAADRGVVGHGDGAWWSSCCTSFRCRVGIWVSRRRAAPTDGPSRSCATGRQPSVTATSWAGSSGRPGASAPRRMPRSVGMKASGSRSARMATYSAVHGPMPGSATSERRSSSGSAPASITTSPSSTACGQRAQGAATARRHGKRAGVALGQLHECRRVSGRDGSPRRRRRAGLACRLHQPARHGAGPGDRDLLADDGAHGELEPLGRPGHPPAGSRGPGRRSPARRRNASQTATGSASRSSSWRQRATAVVRSRRSESTSSPST